jgi:lambda family phage portal protein
MRIWPFPRIKLFQRSYEGAAGGRRWRGQPDMPVTLAAMNAARGPLARRARYLVANNPLAASGAEAWISALVGTGIKPQSGHADPSIRGRLNLAFEAWTDYADADGLTDYYGLQGVLVRRMVVDGEAFALKLNTPEGLRLRLIDADQVDASLNRELAGGARIIQGVEFDTSGRRTAYHVLPERSGMPFALLALTPRRVPAEDVIHLFRPEPPGQVRGISWFAPVLLRMADLDSWRDAQLVGQKIAAMLTGFITNGDGSG